MATHVDLNGVRTWYEELGRGDPLVVLHPGLVDARAMAASVRVLADHFRVSTPERRGHGHTPDVEGPLPFEVMADNTVAFLERVVGGPARLLGVSDGAMVALLTAVRRPDLVEQLVCIAGPFNRDGWVPEAIDPANAPPDEFATSYGEVTLEHALEFYRALPRGELAIVPGTSHGLLVEKPELCHHIILDFLTNDPVPTFAPIRRRTAP